MKINVQIVLFGLFLVPCYGQQKAKGFAPIAAILFNEQTPRHTQREYLRHSLMQAVYMEHEEDVEQRLKDYDTLGVKGRVADINMVYRIMVYSSNGIRRGIIDAPMLFGAVSMGNARIVRLLLDAGADLTAKIGKQTVVDVARNKEHILQVLREYEPGSSLFD